MVKTKCSVTLAVWAFKSGYIPSETHGTATAAHLALFLHGKMTTMGDTWYVIEVWIHCIETQYMTGVHQHEKKVPLYVERYVCTATMPKPVISCLAWRLLHALSGCLLSASVPSSSCSTGGKWLAPYLLSSPWRKIFVLGQVEAQHFVENASPAVCSAPAWAACTQSPGHLWALVIEQWWSCRSTWRFQSGMPWCFGTHAPRPGAGCCTVEAAVSTMGLRVNRQANSYQPQLSLHTTFFFFFWGAGAQGI